MIKKKHTFSVNYESEQDDQIYEGVFTCRKMSVMDMSKVNLRKSQLSGGMYTVRDDNGVPTGQGIDEDTDFFNFMLATLETVLEQKPQWWNLSEISDRTLINKVFKEVMDFESTFRKRRDGGAAGGKSDSSSQENGTKESPKSVSGNISKKVVDSEVFAALEP